MSALPHFSDVDLLGYGKRIIDFDSQVTVYSRSSCGPAGPEPLEGCLSFCR
jgi:hypothetical protein